MPVMVGCLLVSLIRPKRSIAFQASPPLTRVTNDEVGDLFHRLSELAAAGCKAIFILKIMNRFKTLRENTDVCAA
ncbi:hypothetical protein [Lonsdalea populi]|uniref:hypothetical protein n=1 Tax=Lonsdalea populi TaxID=1172565 RepID=UPI0011BE24D6|nr:hypothetical protein [Lonsdalea populi]